MQKMKEQRQQTIASKGDFLSKFATKNKAFNNSFNE